MSAGERNLTIDAGLVKSGVKPEPERPDPEGPGSGGGGTTDPGSGTTPGTKPPDNRETVPGTIVEGPDTVVGGETDPGETVPGTPGTEERPGSNELPANRPGDRKKPEHPAGSSLPATGEKSPLASWIGLLFCAAAVVMWLSRKRMKQ
ncbi:LPXTG cell wall anchor domain-containing protein [Paenibacillus thiaminolyticus]|uniref:LPXTG cell wall anchor domain-containing protein n=1 Tax=Paenibacillus thiaminolyticus TaxID=49283 RepID=A0A3A3GGQ6_PANTH|nr:LPXTG cell wall anchor domain-containing protein [Paenibacillus thiaminolyticus]RJG22131.1 LPXTG cell wall anchor domain-containing protein [Paenibacillus thiaminolyticus]